MSEEERYIALVEERRVMKHQIALVVSVTIAILTVAAIAFPEARNWIIGIIGTIGTLIVFGLGVALVIRGRNKRPEPRSGIPP